VLALDGEDLRDLPLSLRKTNLERMVSRRRDRPYRAGHVPCDSLVELRAA
jgi:ATP-dependent DNA ligase